MSHGIAIGKVSEASGVKVTTVRFYEQIGLLPVPPRTEGGRRTYGREDVERLTFIRHSRELGFEIDQIRTLLQLQDRPDQSCEEADVIAKARLCEVKEKIASLLALESELERMVEGCSHGRVETCQVIEILADHGKCRHHQHGL
ncbi:MAG: helix-turn-helix domain-containing protein [Alphaproteobacteria bacterium]|nr:helix-turn-helix domain-containing protein [Alphaproteobacteria bacterium]MBU1560719.1 helix-turn-helix domain-containing protein [Alphaproteobacteria bacterium]MBU2302928.1 helix-turn-helix domain-containing protein [Alphaproteobacteria bacterium]MBU2367655.1 helix-turn-helix domain-containing protein [Alphaproteobacteria bacterium]